MNINMNVTDSTWFKLTFFKDTLQLFFKKQEWRRFLRPRNCSLWGTFSVAIERKVGTCSTNSPGWNPTKCVNSWNTPRLLSKTLATFSTCFRIFMDIPWISMSSPQPGCQPLPKTPPQGIGSKNAKVESMRFIASLQGHAFFTPSEWIPASGLSRTQNHSSSWMKWFPGGQVFFFCKRRCVCVCVSQGNMEIWNTPRILLIGF